MVEIMLPKANRVKKGKVCKTLAQWRQMTESGNELARRLVEDGTSRPSGQ